MKFAHIKKFVGLDQTQSESMDTPKKTNIAPKNGGFQ